MSGITARINPAMAETSLEQGSDDRTPRTTRLYVHFGFHERAVSQAVPPYCPSGSKNCILQCCEEYQWSEEVVDWLCTGWSGDARQLAMTRLIGDARRLALHRLIGNARRLAMHRLTDRGLRLSHSLVLWDLSWILLLLVRFFVS